MDMTITASVWGDLMFNLGMGVVILFWMWKSGK